MTPSSRDIDPQALERRLGALPGVAEVRAAADPAEPAYLVGGAVRDLMLGVPEIANVDFVVEGDAAALAARIGGVIAVHERFGTVTIGVGGVPVDIASARRESYAEPGALPDVEPAPLADDLERRDFTVNAIAVPMGGAPEPVDPRGGRADLRAGLLRVLHDRSFEDDPTRALRAARYAARLGFELEPGTAALLGRADLDTVSAERVDSELRRQAAEPEPERGLALIAEWGLIAIESDAVALAAGVSRLAASTPWHGFVAAGEAVMATIPAVPSAARELAAVDPSRPSEAVAAARGRKPPELALGRALGAEWLDRYVSEWRHVRLEIGGEDLIAAGVGEGPAVGRGLEAALRAKLDGEAAGRDDELRVALAAA